MRIVHIVLLAILATLTVSLVAGAGHATTPGLSSIVRTATAGPVAASSLTAVTRTATAGPINSSPIKGIARTATAGPVNSSPIQGIARTATAGPVGTSSLTAVTRTATAGPVGTDAMTAITRALVAGPIEELIKAVVAATRGGSDSSQWNLIGEFTTGDYSNGFSRSIAIDGNTALIGSIRQDNRNVGGPTYGIVHHYEYDGSQWNLIGEFTTGNYSNGFSRSIAIDGNTALIGSIRQDNRNVGGPTYGIVHHYEYDGSQWNLIGEFTTGDYSNGFSRSIAIDGNTALIGSIRQDNRNVGGPTYGIVHHYEYDGSQWNLIGEFTTGNYSNGFSRSIAIDGNTALIGSIRQDNRNVGGPTYGIVHHYEYDGSQWNLIGEFTTGDYSNGFSRSIAIDGNTALIGSIRQDNRNVGGPTYGIVHHYEYDGSQWNLIGEFTTGDYSNGFSRSIAIDGNTALIGSIRQDNRNVGGPTYGIVHHYGLDQDLGTCCVSECGLPVACWDDTTLTECDALGGEWTDGAICADINCGPMQWTEGEGANGNWYQLVEKVGGWNACRDAAIAVGGDLCSHDTQLEDEFISQLVPLEEPGIAWNRVYTGATQAEGSSPAEGWSWVDGSAWTDTNWHTGQPNGGEGHLSVSNQIDDGFGWDDHAEDSSDINFYLIEWSADCNDDGIVDYGQILSGELLDEDCDGIPDVLPCKRHRRLLRGRRVHRCLDCPGLQ